MNNRQAKHQLNIVYQKGWKDCRNEILKIVYGSVAAVLHDEGAEQAQIVEILTQINTVCAQCIESDELLESIYDKVGINIHLDDPLQPIEVTHEPS